MKLEINVAEVHVHIHHELSAPALEAVIVEAAAEINVTLKSIAQEIKQMADSLSDKLDELDRAIATELQQVVDAIAAGSDATQQVESAKARISASIQSLNDDDPTPAAG